MTHRPITPGVEQETIYLVHVVLLTDSDLCSFVNLTTPRYWNFPKAVLASSLLVKGSHQGETRTPVSLGSPLPGRDGRWGCPGEGSPFSKEYLPGPTPIHRSDVTSDGEGR